jgi:hypothetical protein
MGGKAQAKAGMNRARGTARRTFVQNVLGRYYNKAFWTPVFTGVMFHWSFSATC